MSNNDALIRPGDILTAIALLSRLPVRADFTRGARAAWAYPLAGVAIAAIAAAPTAGALALGLAPSLAALIWLSASVVLCGAMHEDGLADCADGFWGGWEPARRLEIMKDSHIGAYGVIAMCLSLAARWGTLTLILSSQNWLWGLIAIALLSRATMPVLMSALPNARNTGLSQSQGRPQRATATLAAAVAVLCALVLTGLSGLWLATLAGLTAVTCAAIARNKIGGQTGDVLGATQQITEVTLLFALTVFSG
ncbi:adenosylcobinamide-GDP ribazoletransferase [Shimia abyssi]|uniref:Adenosylcobinamide-GDP ribazoletransferase n=1 Tax=Shimia abyssi TaxID=1662395 RepID=A0A2P8F5X9_9RHOB|nr:adenosylcobinamide-GDP ribazoletransferase [Shimia abyssi]PSL17121.1 cobalamin-5'-phosphate synthase [Shimia abyssi]